MRRGFAPIIIIALIAAFVIGIGATVGYFKLKPKPTVPTSQVQPSPTPADLSSETQVKDDETANWKTYKNAQYGFEVKYPPQWGVEDRKTEFIISDGSLNFYIIPSNAGRGTYFTETRKSSIDVSNVKGERTNFLTDNKEVFISMINFPNYNKNGWSYGYLELSASGSPELEVDTIVSEETGKQSVKGKVENFEVLDQILSTFQFIN